MICLNRDNSRKFEFICRILKLLESGTMILDGEFFSVKSEDYNEKTYNCVVQAVEKLDEIGDKPLMMLGKIQSGKTRSFIGVISLAFDNGYDLAVVLMHLQSKLQQE